MRTSSEWAPQPDKRMGQTATVQPIQNLHYVSNTGDSITLLRRQQLAALGMSGLRASLVADLAWGAVA